MKGLRGALKLNKEDMNANVNSVTYSCEMYVIAYNLFYLNSVVFVVVGTNLPFQFLCFHSDPI